jgi:hypothetical protein
MLRQGSLGANKQNSNFSFLVVDSLGLHKNCASFQLYACFLCKMSLTMNQMGFLTKVLHLPQPWDHRIQYCYQEKDHYNENRACA